MLKKTVKQLFPVIVASLLLAPPQLSAQEDDLELVNRPVNTSGLTGLLFTTAPYAEPSGTVEAGVGVLSINSTDPDYTLNQIPLVTVTAGIAPHSELALKGSYFRKSSDSGSIKERRTGDAELAFKWNFRRQDEGSRSPAVALIVGAMLPTDTENPSSSMSHWGARLGISVGSEIAWSDYVLGVYADGTVVVQDLTHEMTRDRYGSMNAGLLFPISKHSNLQMLVEYNLITGIDKTTAEGGDYSGLSYGLRLVSRKFNLSIGTQFMHTAEPGFDNTKRVIGMTSYKF